MKLLLPILVFGTIICCNAQQKTELKSMRLNPSIDFHESIKKTDHQLPYTKIKAPTKTLSSTLFSNSQVGISSFIEDITPLYYNSDLNMIAFTQRIPDTSSWPTVGLPSGAGENSFIVTKYSIDNGSNWNGVCYFNNINMWSRYPSGVIANPFGNTNTSLAKFVSIGPATSASGFWGSNWFASILVDSSGNQTTNDQQAYYSDVADSNFTSGIIYSNFNTIANGTTIWSGARLHDYNYTYVAGAAILKGQAGTNITDPYTWSSDTLTFNNWRTGTYDQKYCSNPKIAFAPDGLTGYILINGVLDSASGPSSKSIQPNVWKTTDGGISWVLVNQFYDWKTNHPEICYNLIPTLHDSDWNGLNVPNESYPAFFDANGAGITVDNNGLLHYVTTISPAPTTHKDSLLYSFAEDGFSHIQFDNLSKPWIYDFTTNGNGV